MNNQWASSMTGRVVRSSIKSKNLAPSSSATTETTMQKIIKVTVITLVMLGVLAVGVLGTETRLLFFWPAGILLGIAAVVAVMRGKWTMRSAPADSALAAALVFGLYLIIRGIASPVIASAREDILLVLACAVVYTLSATALSTPRRRMVLVSVLLLITVGNLAMGFVHFSGQWSFHIVPGYMRSFGDAHRIGGFFNNPNHLAAFLVMMTLFFSSLAIFGRGGAAWRLTLVFIAISSSIGVTLTVSRGAMAGLAAGVLTLVFISLLLLRKVYPHLFLRALVGVTVMSVFVGTAFFIIFVEQVGGRFKNGDVLQGDPRPVIWRAALAQHAEHPWLGAGARMFYEGCITFRTADSVSWMKDAQFTHGEYIQVLADYGWIGLALLVALLFFHFTNGWRFLQWFANERFPRTSSLQGRNLGLTVGAFTALVATLVHAVFEFHFHVPATALTAAFFFGILANPGMESAMNPPRRLPLVRPLLKFTLFASGFVLLCGAWTVGRANYFVEQAVILHDDDELNSTRIALLGKSIESDPYNANTWYERGRVRLDGASGNSLKVAAGILQGAMSDLEKARALNPYNNFMACALADAYDASNRPDEAERCARDAIRLAPLYMEPRLTLAIHFHRLSRFAEAEEYYLKAGDARAGANDEWYALYKQMLQDAAMQ